jgi:3-oxoacyl-[acyl-carrier protein] reductase
LLSTIEKFKLILIKWKGTQMDLFLKGKNVLVTAASMGIGRASAEEFIKEGANVAISSRITENLNRAASEIEINYGVKPFTVACDLDNKGDIDSAAGQVIEKFGSIDVLVNNCGGPAPGYFETLTDEEWQDAFGQVLMSAIRFTRLVLPGMKERKWGRIINITSLSVKQPIENLILSNSLRNAVTAFSKTLSTQVGRYNITINNVAPGYTLTSRIHELAEVRAKAAGTTPDKILESMTEDVPMKRLASPDEVAALVTFLASERAGYITGSTIGVDGGAVKSTY